MNESAKELLSDFTNLRVCSFYLQVSALLLCFLASKLLFLSETLSETRKLEVFFVVVFGFLGILPPYL